MSIIEENIELQISEETLIASKEIVMKLYKILNPNIKGVLDKIKELWLEDLIPKKIIKHLESNFPSWARKLFFWGEEEIKKLSFFWSGEKYSTLISLRQYLHKFL